MQKRDEHARDVFVDWRHRRRDNTTSEAAALWPRPCVRHGGTLWMVGNSVMRMHFFAALALLNGDTFVGIDEQIKQCGRGGESRGRRPGQGLSCLGPCRCSADIDGGRGRVVFVWQQRLFHMGDEFVLALNRAGTGGSSTSLRRGAPGTRGENATPAMKRLAGLQIQPGDAVIANMGLDDIVTLAKYSFGKRRPKPTDRHADGSAWTLTDYLERWRQSVADGAPALATSMAAAWQSGRAAFWRSSTPVCHAPGYRTHWGMLTGPRAHLPQPSISSSGDSDAPSTQGGGPAHGPAPPLLEESTTVNDLLAHSDASVAESMTARGVPALDLTAIDRAAATRVQTALAAQALQTPRADGKGQTAQGDGQIAGHQASSGPEIRETPGTPCDLPGLDSGDRSRGATRFACRCAGYQADPTHLHPHPAVAAEQVRQMLKSMAFTCAARA